MTQVFISHSSQDRAFVEGTLVPLLAQRGVTHFYSGDHIAGGADFNRRIHEALEASEWVLVVLSPAACASEWVGAEVEWAFTHRPGRVLPLLRAPCQVAALHVRLIRLQLFDFHARPADAARKLLDLLDPPRDGPAPAPELESDLGKYRIVARLGSGAFGTVYEAWDRVLRRRVALKVAKGDALGPPDPRELQRFTKEAQLAAELDHPHIVRIYESGVVDRRAYYAMELVDGVSLGRWIEDRRALARADARRAHLDAKEIRLVLGWGAQAAHALHRAHTHERRGEGLQPIIHRDVKPDNLMIDATDQIKVLDFGLARDEKGSLLLTQRADVLGTPMYMSPEQALSSREVDARSDVYSLGMTLYSALTLREPFEASNSETLLRQVVTSDPPRPRAVVPGLAAEVEAIVLKATARAPERRYPSALALAEDLERYLGHRPTLARPLGPFGRARKWARRHPRLLGTLGGVLLVGLLGAWIAERRHADRALTQGAEALELARGLVERVRPHLVAEPVPLWERRAATLEGGALRAWLDQGPAHDAAALAAWKETRARRDQARRAAREALEEAVRAFQAAEAALRAAGDEAQARRAGAERHLVRVEWLLALGTAAARAEARAEVAAAARLLDAPDPRLAALAARATGHARLRVDLPGAWVEVTGAEDLAALLAAYRTEDPVHLELAGASGAPLTQPAGSVDPETLAPRVRRLSGARAALFPIDPRTLVTAPEPLAAYAGVPLPLVADDLAPGEYLVVITDPGRAPHTRTEPLSFPVLLAAEDAWEESIPIALSEIPPGMAFVPAGPVLLGALDDNPDQRPLRFVEDVPAFFLARHELTVAEVAAWAEARDPAWRSAAERAGGSWVWEARANPVFGAGAGWRTPYAGTALAGEPFDPRHPVVHLTPAEGHAVLAALGARPPTEVEWEKAARGLDGRRYPWGEVEPQELGWRVANADTQAASEADGFWTSAPVGAFPAGRSPYGVEDLSGNVFELTATAYRADLYLVPDLLAAARAPGPPFAVRGGAYSGIAKMIDGAHRGAWPYAMREGVQESCSALGLRAARDLPAGR